MKYECICQIWVHFVTIGPNYDITWQGKRPGRTSGEHPEVPGLPEEECTAMGEGWGYEGPGSGVMNICRY